MPSEFNSGNAKKKYLENKTKPRYTSSTHTWKLPRSVHPSQQTEYIDELERLLLQIQSKERKSDTEFKSARRAVIEENQMLRTLLRRIGITDAEVEGQLSNSNHIGWEVGRTDQHGDISQLITDDPDNPLSQS